MRHIWRLFVGDLKRLSSNVVTLIAVIGLVALPSIFSWYNMLACWNVFDNTGNLTVAVANTDEGYMSDLVPIEVNVGDRIVSALRENDQLNWTFTTEDDAIDGTRSGRYYAAVVIPPSFSRDMMSFFSEDTEHARIVYYSNEKKNAVAPKVTDQGADQVSHQVNLVFTETLSKVALGVSQTFVRYTDEADVDSAVATMSEHLSKVGSNLSEAGSILELYADMIGAARKLVEDSGTLIANAQTASHGIADTVGNSGQVATDVSGSIGEATEALGRAIEQSASSYESLPSAIGTAFDSASALSADAVRQLRNQADDLDNAIDYYTPLVATLRAIDDPLGEAAKVADDLENLIKAEEKMRDALSSAADDIEKADASAQDGRSATTEIAQQAKRDVEAAQLDYDENLAPMLKELAAAMSETGTTLAQTGERLDRAAERLIGATDSLSKELQDAESGIARCADKLKSSGESVSSLGGKLTEALSAGDTQSVRDLIYTNPSTLAEAISAPIAIDRHAVFPVENFGSAMSPLYTTLALWIGALIMMVTIKVVPGKRTVATLDNPTPRQLLLGRFGIVTFISLLQSTTIALGNLFFLGVQATHPWLYMLCFWISGLVFAFIIYTLVALFANLGKALSVILLIVQVSGGGGSFPMQLLPDFFQTVSPYLPITHAVNAMRAAMFGVYANDFWIEIGTLALFAVPLAIMGFFLHGPLSRFVPKFVARVEKSKLM
ncbi:MAG: YhgE/Pip domain-containing protein [Eggerthellaceae bacterium]|nr:YhgE/Pip domain-containing protein [Eggerthellaceae bacterium]